VGADEGGEDVSDEGISEKAGSEEDEDDEVESAVEGGMRRDESWEVSEFDWVGREDSL
jgi:hypothetical protein